MPTALVSSSQEPGAPPLVDDLISVGITVVDPSCNSISLHDVVRSAPDLVIVYDAHPDSALFDSTSAIGASAPRPVIVFTVDPDAEKMDLAVRSGIHAYVVGGYHRARLRSVIHLAQARFRFDQLLRDELTEVSQRFAERKLVDRAKGILMGARQLREEQAYSALRSAAMRTKQRIGQVARQVIDTARYAEAVNRAGQLRMLSQRLVKLYALATAGTETGRTAGLSADSITHVEENLAILGRSLSKKTFGDLLDAILAPWQPMRRALALPPDPALLEGIDALAEEMLLRAEVLTESLEVAGFAVALHVINVAGRQRMLSQRLAKDALLASLLSGDAAERSRRTIEVTREQIEASLDYLGELPMSNDDITRALSEARAHWAAMQPLPDADTAGGRARLAELSELLLASFERLTDQLERAIQALTG